MTINFSIIYVLNKRYSKIRIFCLCNYIIVNQQYKQYKYNIASIWNSYIHLL